MKKFLIISLFCFFSFLGCMKQEGTIVITTDDSMAQKLYAMNNQTYVWFSSKKNIRKAKEWLHILDSANKYGLVSDPIQLNQLRVALLKTKNSDESFKEKTDQQITALVLNFIKVLQEGNVQFDYEEIPLLRDSVYINQLLQFNPKKSAIDIVALLECKNHDYWVLKNYLNDSITPVDTLKYKSVIKAMNYLRYMSVHEQSEYIVVNIPETVARYYKDGTLQTQMRTVVGRKRSPTPTIASNISTIITFPHWNVPRSIATKEILPKVQKDEIYLEQNNLAVVNANGVEIEESELDWMEYTAKNFPYFFRQSTGSANALGVLKFDFQNPYSIYLHSTSLQSAFLKENRFLSHGCIRLEKPIDLANYLLRGKLDIEELKAGKKDTESKRFELPHKIPVYIIYSPVHVEGNNVTFLPDVYGLIK